MTLPVGSVVFAPTGVGTSPLTEAKVEITRSVARRLARQILQTPLPAGQEIPAPPPPALPAGQEKLAVPPLEEIERQWILHALKVFGQNKEQAAKALGVSTKTIYNKLTRYRRERRLK